MAILVKGQTFANADDVTSTKLNNLVDSATFVSGAAGTTDDSTLEVNGSGRLQVKDSGIATGKIAASAVTTAKIASSTSASDGVTLAKIQYLADMKVIGNVSGGTAVPTSVAILDEDTMASDSATSLCTQQSIKAYVDSHPGFSPSAYAGGETMTFPNGMILKCGTTAVAASANLTITFATAFPSGIVSVILQVIENSSSDRYAPKVGTASKTAFNIRNSQGSGMSVYWMAMGY
jgi:hypothetical protein